MATLDKVRLLWKDIEDSYTETEILDGIALSELRVDQNGFCGNAELATAYLTCHTMAVALRDGEAGSVGSKKEGDLSINFSPGLNNDGFDQTSFGRDFKQLKNECYTGISTGLT
jgi:hypothetical protein